MPRARSNTKLRRNKLEGRHWSCKNENMIKELYKRFKKQNLQGLFIVFLVILGIQFLSVLTIIFVEVYKFF